MTIILSLVRVDSDFNVPCAEKKLSKRNWERGHLINATTVDGRLLVGRADGEDLRQGGRRCSEGGIREVGFLTFESNT